MSETQLSFPVAALLDQASSDPQHVVLVAEDDAWTSARLAEETARLAGGLLEQGVQPGDRVAVHLHNSVEAALAYLGCLRMGAVAVPLNTRLPTPELRELVLRTRPAAYLGAPALYDRFAAVEHEILPLTARFLTTDPDPDAAAEDTGTGAWADLLRAGDDRVDGGVDAPVGVDAPAVLLATSGTTGRSKIVVWSQRTLSALHLSAAGRGIADGDVLPLMTPLMHAAGVFYLLNAVTQRATAVLIPQVDAGAVLDAVQDHGCSSLFGLPFIYAELNREQRRHPRRITTLRKAYAAGDTCPADVEAQFSDVFGLPLRSYWAATEDVGATIASETVGPYMRVIPEAHVQVVDENGAPVDTGDTGELLVSSPTTSPGYWEDDGRVTPLPEGVFHSGDLVRQRSADAEDVLEYAGRTKDVIIRGGSNISPEDVERALRDDPQVGDAAVVGVPDPELGQRVGALVVMTDDAEGTPEQIVDGVAQRLAAYKVPERVRSVEATPRNALTKVDRDEALALLQDTEASS